jgi:hypothetical protein
MEKIQKLINLQGTKYTHAHRFALIHLTLANNANSTSAKFGKKSSNIQSMRIIPIMWLVWQLTLFSKENRFSKIPFEINSLKFQTWFEMQHSSNSNLDSMSFQRANMKKY